MKRILLISVLLVSISSFAQEVIVIGQKRPPMIASINYSGPCGNYYGLGLEVGSFLEDGMTEIINVNYGTMTLDKNGKNRNGDGFSLEAGGRQYIIMNRNYARFYLENLFSYSYIKFSDADYSGVYEYISLVNPSIGYKFKFGDHFSIDPSGGLAWRIEIMSRGHVDNKDFSNFVGKFGVKLGYSF